MAETNENPLRQMTLDEALKAKDKADVPPETTTISESLKQMIEMGKERIRKGLQQPPWENDY